MEYTNMDIYIYIYTFELDFITSRRGKMLKLE